MQNRLVQLFEREKKQLLSIFFTAGFPALHDTVSILHALQTSGADLVEIGMPFSDPIADGETIQLSSKRALENGMSIRLLFEQLHEVRQQIHLPIVLMGYLNPVMQFGVEDFCKKAAEIGIDGLIIPDLPIELYIEEYKHIFEKYNLANILLVTPQTSEARIRLIDEHTQGFIYLVAENSITGKVGEVNDAQRQYFSRIAGMNLKNPQLIGFGISDKKSFQTACQYASGAIIGSAFIRVLQESKKLNVDIQEFIHKIKY